MTMCDAFKMLLESYYDISSFVNIKVRKWMYHVTILANSILFNYLKNYKMESVNGA
jgi:hypothetical protein